MKDNLIITLRERGKLVASHESHNIWLNTGRTFLRDLISFSSFSPDTFAQVNLPRYIGFGIGGNRQNALTVANASPCSVHYPGTNLNNDITATIQTLERPVRISWAGGGPNPPTGSNPLVYDPTDVWTTQITPAIHPTTFSVEWSCSFTEAAFSSSPFLLVPLSEIGLFISGDSPNVYNNLPVAYDTFDTIPKTANFSMDVSWTVRF